MDLEPEVGEREEKRSKFAEDLEYRERRGFVQPKDPVAPNSDPRPSWRVALDSARRSGVVSLSQADGLEDENYDAIRPLSQTRSPLRQTKPPSIRNPHAGQVSQVAIEREASLRRGFAIQLGMAAVEAEERARARLSLPPAEPFSMSQVSTESAYVRRDEAEAQRLHGSGYLAQEAARVAIATEAERYAVRRDFLWPLLWQGDYGLATLMYETQLKSVARVCRDQLYLWNDEKLLWERRTNKALTRAVSRGFEEFLKSEEAEFKIQRELGGDPLKAITKNMKMSGKVTGVVTQLWPLLERGNQDFADQLDMVAHELPIADGQLINLKTKQVRLRTIRDYWSKALKVKYQPERGTDNAYQLFCDFAKDDQDLVYALRSIFGYSLTRDNEAREFYIHLGDFGFNGKSTLFEMLSEILEHFMMPVKVELFTSNAANSSGSASPELMCLAIVRLAWISEWKENQVINEDMVKAFTGGDRKIGRGLYENEMRTIQPRFKLHIPTNFAPVYDASSVAMNKRNRNVPWKNEFVPTREATDRLNAIDRSEIFTWLVEGAYEYYQTYSVRTCRAITEATLFHIQSLDTVRQFIDERYTINLSIRKPDKYSVTVTQLWGEYEAWCKDTNVSDKVKVKPHKFAKNLKMSYQVVKSEQLSLRVIGQPGQKGYYYLALRKKSILAEPEEEEQGMPLAPIDFNSIQPYAPLLDANHA